LLSPPCWSDCIFLLSARKINEKNEELQKRKNKGKEKNEGKDKGLFPVLCGLKIIFQLKSDHTK